MGLVAKQLLGAMAEDLPQAAAAEAGRAAGGVVRLIVAQRSSGGCAGIMHASIRLDGAALVGRHLRAASVIPAFQSEGDQAT
jgi:hypothetical protein